MTSSHTEQRKLAAIMFTDMVGYSALSQHNEVLALELLEEHRRLLRSLFPTFNGFEIKTIGDAFLVEFASALEAVRCGIEIQRVLFLRNGEASPDRRIEVRIGIHVGDVVHRENDVLGDGVNIASRIEPLADSGGVCISRAVFEQVRNHLTPPPVALGKTALKNIQAPVELFRVALPWEEGSSAALFPRGSRARTNRILLVAGGVALLALCVAGVWIRYFIWPPAPMVSTAPTNAPPPVAQSLPPKSVAVLPFVNISADKDNEYLSDGITEDLCTALAQVRGLRVPARTSCFVFKGKAEDIRKIGQQLNVATVLEGSVSKAGNKLRINVQLINIADGFHLWATNYDQEMSDLLALRSDIAREVVAALRVQLLPDETRQLDKKPTLSSAAHRLYLQGRAFWNQGTPESVTQSIGYLERALSQDTNFALAYATLADCHLTLALLNRSSIHVALPQARAAALKAVELDSEAGEAHAALAAVRTKEWNWTSAEAEYKRAIELSPNSAAAHNAYGSLLGDLRRFDEAVREARRAQDLDPLSPIVTANLGMILYFNRSYDEAIAEYRKLLELSPQSAVAHWGQAHAYGMKGMPAEFITEIQTARTLVGNSPRFLGCLGYAYGVAGKTEEAREVLEELKTLVQRGAPLQTDVAHVYSGLNDREQTLAWLEQAVEIRADIWLPKLNSDPVWQNLRSEPRFVALLSKMGLAK